MDPFWYIIPGILTPLENVVTWDYRAQGWLHDRGLGKAVGFNYSDGILGGVLARQHQSEIVASDLTRARATGELAPIRVVGHSNGCAIILQALEDHPLCVVESVDLIAAAANVDCVKNGLNAVVGRGQIKERITLYISAGDEVLGVPALSYGGLGKYGPSNLSTRLASIIKRIDSPAPGCGHSDWVYRDFDQTMMQIVTQQ